jgi:DNA-binding HxlR family transcriptional regulator
MSLIDLRRTVGSPAPTTMRGHLRTLAELGIIERRQENAFPGTVVFELGRPGRDLLVVVDVLEAWLDEAPIGPIELGSTTAKNSIKALVEGWSSAIVRALAAKPLSLTELSRLINGLSYPSLERRLGTMRLAGLIERCSGGGRGTPYAVTDWLRRAAGPIAASIRWERRHLGDRAAGVSRLDIEAIFLLAVPMARLSGGPSGLCRLGVDLQNAGEHRLAGVVVEVKEGRIASCLTRLNGEADAWALGSPTAWLSALIEQDLDQLEIGGDSLLAIALVDKLHGSTFRTPAWH